MNYWTLKVEAGNALRSDGNDLPLDMASGFRRLASLENIVKVIRAYKTFLIIIIIIIIIIMFMMV